MRCARKPVIVSVLTVSLAGAAYLGLGAFHNAQFALADQQVKVSREQASTLSELASVFREAGKTVGPSVVNIRITKEVQQPQMPQAFGGPMFRQFFREFGGQGEMPLPPGFQEGPRGNLREIGTGSGVIMDASGGVGYVVTNNHVAGDASEMEITLADGRVIKDAKLVGADPKTDLAVVEIKADHLIPAKWADSSRLQEGDWVLALGSPFGYVGSMTHGIVSALHRQAGILGADGYENFIQVDAPINPGNSGGPLVNMQGEVVGINTAIATSSGGFQGVGFDIPEDEAKPIYDELKAHGKIVRGWLGAEIASVTQLRDEAKSAGYTGDTGVLVKGVLKAAPASGKLEPGDVITTLNSKRIADAAQLRNQIALAAPGSDVTLGLVRAGKQQEIHVKLGEQPANTNVLANRGESAREEKTLGLRLADPNEQLAQRYSVPAQTGAMVVAVNPTSPAAEAGLHPGDLITKIGDADVHSAKEARDLLAASDLKKGVKMYVTNREGSEFVFVEAS